MFEDAVGWNPVEASFSAKTRYESDGFVGEKSGNGFVDFTEMNGQSDGLLSVAAYASSGTIIADRKTPQLS